jgi:hypothetical protein
LNCRAGLSEKHPKDVVGENNKVEKKDKHSTNSHTQPILADTKDDDAKRGQDIFHDEEVDVSIANEETHKRVDLHGPILYMEDREVGIENGEQDNDKESEEKT